MSIKKIVVALPNEEEHLPALHEWGAKFEWEHVEEVHFLHIIKKTITTLEFGIVEIPDEETYQEMIPTYEKFLHDEAAKIVPSTFKGKLFFHLKKDFDPREEAEHVLRELGADLVVLTTPGRHGIEGLFRQSFTEFMIKHSPCDIYVAKSEHHPQL